MIAKLFVSTWPFTFTAKTNILKRLTTEITEALPEKKQESSESKTQDTTKSTDSEGKKPAVEDTGKNKGQGDQGEVTLEDTDQDSKGRVESSKEKEDGSKDKADTNNNSEKDNKKKSEKSKDVREMMTLLMGELDRARTEGRVVVIVIDGLDKIEETFGKIAKVCCKGLIAQNLSFSVFSVYSINNIYKVYFYFLYKL